MIRLVLPQDSKLCGTKVEEEGPGPHWAASSSSRGRGGEAVGLGVPKEPHFRALSTLGVHLEQRKASSPAFLGRKQTNVQHLQLQH